MLSNKIKSSSGATILLALLFFLMCALAGSVVLAAGTASSGRIKGLKEQEQSYYRVTSAAELLRDEIEGQIFSAYKDLDGSGDTEHLQEPGGKLNGLLRKSVYEIFDNQASYSNTLSIESDNAIKALNTDFAYEMDMEYNISITIPASNNSNQEYACTLKIPAALSKFNTTVIKGDEEINREITTVTWNGGVITKNANTEKSTGSE